MPDEYSEWSQQMRRSNREFESIFIEVIEQGIIRDTGSPTTIARRAGPGRMDICWFNPESTQSTAEEIATTFADTVLNGLQTGRRPVKRPRGRTAVGQQEDDDA